MIPGRRDYNLIGTDEDPIPQDEPVFILRAQDELALPVMLIYAVLAETQMVDPTLARSVREHADLFRVWPTRKKPDLPPRPFGPLPDWIARTSGSKPTRSLEDPSET